MIHALMTHHLLARGPAAGRPPRSSPKRPGSDARHYHGSTEPRRGPGSWSISSDRVNYLAENRVEEALYESTSQP
jgi:hypothetical protein